MTKVSSPRDDGRRRAVNPPHNRHGKPTTGTADARAESGRVWGARGEQSRVWQAVAAARRVRVDPGRTTCSPGRAGADGGRHGLVLSASPGGGFAAVLFGTGPRRFRIPFAGAAARRGTSAQGCRCRGGARRAEPCASPGRAANSLSAAWSGRTVRRLPSRPLNLSILNQLAQPPKVSQNKKSYSRSPLTLSTELAFVSRRRRAQGAETTSRSALHYK